MKPAPEPELVCSVSVTPTSTHYCFSYVVCKVDSH